MSKTDEFESAQFALNENQQIAIFGLDFSISNIEIQPAKNIDFFCLGKLDEQSYLLKKQINNSLRRDKWNFKNFPNPEIVLITKKN